MVHGGGDRHQPDRGPRGHARRGASRRSSGIEVWALVAAVAWLGDVAFTFMYGDEFTVAWYAARLLGMAASAFVFGTILGEVVVVRRHLLAGTRDLETRLDDLLEAQRLRDHVAAVRQPRHARADRRPPGLPRDPRRRRGRSGLRPPHPRALPGARQAAEPAHRGPPDRGARGQRRPRGAARAARRRLPAHRVRGRLPRPGPPGRLRARPGRRGPTRCACSRCWPT